MSEGLPTISRLRSFRDASRMIRNPVQIFEEYRQQSGNSFSFHFGGFKKAIVSCDPALIQHVLKTNYQNYHKSEIQVSRMGHFLGSGLLTSHGKYWLNQRRIMQQGFHKKQLANLLHQMYDNIDEAMTDFDREAAVGSIDISAWMRRLTFQTVSRSLFSTNLSDQNITRLSNSISVIQEFMVRQIVRPYMNPWFGVSGELGKYEKIRHDSDKIILDHIRQRRQEKIRHQDMLDILMGVTYEDTGKGMNDTQLLSECMQLLVAGHETSSTVLSWAWYLLCKHPHCIEKIRNELRPFANERLSFDALTTLPYLSQVLEEAMRLYPPFWMVDRVALSSDRIAGIDIPKNALVIVFIYGVHHSSTYWEQPEVFNPERFSKENKKQHIPFTHIPFGGGPRGCIGSGFAMMQMMAILTAIIRRYDFRLQPDRLVEPAPMLILRPGGSIDMHFARKHESNSVKDHSA